MFARINCCVPGCRRGTRKFENADDVICGKCWRFISKAAKADYRRTRAALEAMERQGDAEDAACTVMPETLQKYHAAHEAFCEVWSRCKSEAIEAAAGI